MSSPSETTPPVQRHRVRTNQHPLHAQRAPWALPITSPRTPCSRRRPGRCNDEVAANRRPSSAPTVAPTFDRATHLGSITRSAGVRGVKKKPSLGMFCRLHAPFGACPEWETMPALVCTASPGCEREHDPIPPGSGGAPVRFHLLSNRR